MKITASQLRKIINEEIVRLSEAGNVPKAGTQTAAETEGTLDVKRIADTLKLDGAKLKTAVTNLRAGKRSGSDNQILGDIVAALINASEQDTIKVMNVLKKVESAD